MFNPFKPEKATNFVYWRNATLGEICFGHGAIHYREFTIHECINLKTGRLKKWFVSPDDGLRYNKPR
jgi:hypothetical protein